MDNTIGNKLKSLRENKKLTLDEVAKKIGTSRQTLFKYENGIVTNIPSNKIEDLAGIYGVSPAYLMGWVEDERHIRNNSAHGTAFFGNAAPTVVQSAEYKAIKFSIEKEAGLTPFSVADNALAPRIQQGDSVFVSAPADNEVLIPHKTLLAIQAVNNKGEIMAPYVVLRLFYYAPDLSGIITYVPGAFNNAVDPIYYPFNMLDTASPLIGIARSVSFNIL
ncbi:helix-turn-helix transcriptional regulator [Veillonella sp.]|uniref:helix-turn-helix domain-containing protein n=1 Tax=Veillonella sp. TaxID=1926307 RepID=UPI0029092575|nr:helix-turn-helix transcriptional regulator [Veillonella sp.]MDU5294489.1 helix-turn-helix transcriptional regulator [Veillonella sp.]MDU5870109.1 helix-turn-helix transcriptional regulator [Veillonella sp.]